MATILEQIQKKKNFDAFVNENMKTSTYKIGWDGEMSVEYEASASYQAAVADYAAAMLGTVIDINSGKPKHGMPSIGELTGTLATMGDEWQIDNDRLRKYYYMEQRLRDKAPSMTKEQYQAQFATIVKFLFNPFELASIAPHRRIWAMYLEGLSDGQVTVSKTNNALGTIWSAPLANGISKKLLRATDVVWSTATLATMDVLAVLQYAEDTADAAGKTVLKHRVSKATASLICQCTQLKNLIGMNLGKLKTNTTPSLSLETVNLYLVGIGLAPIEVVNEKGILSDGTAVSFFKDGRLVSQCAERVAVLKVCDALESIDPHPNKVYTTFNDNLVSQWRKEEGRFVGYEMSAYPVFTGKNDVFILDVTQKADA